MKATGPQDAQRLGRQDARSTVSFDLGTPPPPHYLPTQNEGAESAHTERRFAASDHELSVIVPAYNEEHRLPATLDGLSDYLDRWGIDYRVLVVDDGSRDKTARLTEGRGFRFATISQPNRGKGAAIRNGMLRATGRVIAFTDADLPYDLDGVRTANLLIRARECDVVFAVRDLRESAVHAPRRLARTLATHVFRGLMRHLVSREINDTQCGLKAFSRRAALEIFTRTTLDGFAFDAEVVYLTHRLGLEYRRIPVTLINEYASTISLAPRPADADRRDRRPPPRLRGEYALDGASPRITIEEAAPKAAQAAA